MHFAHTVIPHIGTPVPALTPPVFNTPDILNNWTFGTWGNWDAGGSGTPPSPAALDTTVDMGNGVTTSAKFPWSPGVGGMTCAYPWYFKGVAQTYDRVWVRWYYKASTQMQGGGGQKFGRFQSSGFSDLLGTLYTDQSGISNSLYIFDTEADAGPTTPVLSASTWDNTVHYFEIDCWRNGDTALGSDLPSAAFWQDGVQVTGSGSFTGGQWLNNRIYATPRVSSAQLGVFMFWTVMNNTLTNSGQINISRVSISSLGRIGP